MNQFEQFTTPKQERISRENKEWQDLGRRLSVEGLTFTWPGIDPSAYRRLKNDEEEFPGMATPIDELIERCVREGIKVYVRPDQKKVTVYILPAGSDDFEQDGLFPKHLQIDAFMDGDLATLIAQSR